MSALIAVLGPTASGKSALAMAVAERIEGEIIACDAMTVYKGLDIGTAKPTSADQEAIPHHLIDVVDPGTPYDVARYVTDAQAALADCTARQKPAILCGGSGLYARSLLYTFEPLPADPDIAASVRAQFDSDGLSGLLEELAAIDPESAQRTRENPRRVLRAVEAVRILKSPIPDNRETATPAIPCRQYVLMPDAAANRAAIASRAESMFNDGWVAETEHLITTGFLKTPTARQAIGYSTIAEYLKGERTRLDALERITIATSRYAKRQRTWFRNQHPGAILLDPPTADTLTATADRIATDWRTTQSKNQPNHT